MTKDEATTSPKDAALKLALDLAIMHHSDDGYAELRSKVRQLAKEALAQDEQSSSQEPCGGCGGSGWVPRDPDIGTDQECFNCNGSGTQPNEPEQKPVAFISPGGHIHYDPYLDSVPLYTTPPQRPWVGLTDGDVFAILEKLQTMYHRQPRAIFVQAIEATLKEKNT